MNNVTILILPSLPQSFKINDIYIHKNEVLTITEQEFNEIDKFWLQHVTIITRNNISNISSSNSNSNIGSTISINSSNNDSNDIDRIQPNALKEDSRDNERLDIERLDMHKIELINLLNKKPSKITNKKT